jgi:hypothetical protein
VNNFNIADLWHPDTLSRSWPSKAHQGGCLWGLKSRFFDGFNRFVRIPKKRLQPQHIGPISRPFHYRRRSEEQQNSVKSPGFDGFSARNLACHRGAQGSQAARLSTRCRQN